MLPVLPALPATGTATPNMKKPSNVLRRMWRLRSVWRTSSSSPSSPPYQQSVSVESSSQIPSPWLGETQWRAAVVICTRSMWTSRGMSRGC